MRIAIEGQESERKVVADLLSPWQVSLTAPDEAELVIVHGNRVSETPKLLIVPLVQNVAKFSQATIPSVYSSPPPITLPLNQEQSLEITPIFFSKNKLSESGDITLPVDVIAEYQLLIHNALEATTCRKYRLLTRAPLPYSLAPKRLKNRIMRQNGKPSQNRSVCGIYPLDALRLLLVQGIERATGKKLTAKGENKRRSCILSHDIDSSEGLNKARAMKKLEEKYDLQSVWYLPTKHFKINDLAVKELADNGEIGAHDTKHDGKLIFLSQTKATERVLEAKHILERASDSCVMGFRAPLLQHSSTILRALKAAGYSYDSSVPSWEPKHPCTMKPHGVGTTYPFEAEGLLEIPITLPQDHQMLTVSGMTCQQTLEYWFDLAAVIKAIGGVVVFSAHPDYEFSELGNGTYEELLNHIASDKDLETVLPSQVTQETLPPPDCLGIMAQ